MFKVADGLHACIVGNVPVILDERLGRYFLLRGAIARHFLSFLHGGAERTDFVALLESRLIVEAASSSANLSEIQPPNFSYEGAKRTRLHRGLLPQALFSQIDAAWRTRYSSLSEVLESLRKTCDNKLPMRRQDGRVTEATVAAVFHAIQFLTPSRNQCIPRSLAIAQMLRRFGHCPTVVIGVKLPIAGHCWVQCEDRLVGDTLDRVLAFQPIFSA